MKKNHNVYEIMNIWPSHGVHLKSFLTTETAVVVSKDSCKVFLTLFLADQ